MSLVLVVEDDPTVAEVVCTYLEAAGLKVEHHPDGPSALLAAATATPLIIVLDVMLPGFDGLEVLRRLRSQGTLAPVLMLTALGDEEHRIRGLEVGADDYLTKPFSPRELVLRVQSILRRSEPPRVPAAEHDDLLRDGDLTIDTSGRKAFLAGRQVALTLREFDLLQHFVQHPNRVLSREALLGAVWGWEFGDPATVTVHVRRLREKIEVVPRAPTRIVTVWGHGYRYDPADVSPT